MIADGKKVDPATANLADVSSSGVTINEKNEHQDQKVLKEITRFHHNVNKEKRQKKTRKFHRKRGIKEKRGMKKANLHHKRGKDKREMKKGKMHHKLSRREKREKK